MNDLFTYAGYKKALIKDKYNSMNNNNRNYEFKKYAENDFQNNKALTSQDHMPATAAAAAAATITEIDQKKNDDNFI